MKQKNLFLDVETDGVNQKRNRILEIGAIYEEDCEVKETFQIYIKHDEYYSDFEEVSQKSHGLSIQFLEENGVTESEAFTKFVEFLDRCVNKFNKTDKMHRNMEMF